MRVFVLLNLLNPMRAGFEALPWFGVMLVLTALGWRLGRAGPGARRGDPHQFLRRRGTLASGHADTIFRESALVAVALGIPIGLWCSRSDRVSAVVTPMIDTLQTIPSFCFIIPVVMLFRVGDVTAMIATVAYAIVPAIRYTNHGIRQVPHQLIEAGIVLGCTKGQLFRRVQLPVALPEIMLGINQTILLSLSMIIICAMVGTRDLGQESSRRCRKPMRGGALSRGLSLPSSASWPTA